MVYMMWKRFRPQNGASERGAEHFFGATFTSDGKCPRPQDELADFTYFSTRLEYVEKPLSNHGF